MRSSRISAEKGGYVHLSLSFVGGEIEGRG